MYIILTSYTISILDAMKRGCTSSSSDRLTGGSDDVNPQQLIMIGEDHYITGATGSASYRHMFPNPAWDINRAISPGCGKKAVVLEVLKVWLLKDTLDIEAAMGTTPQIENYISLYSSPTLIPALAAGSGYAQTLEWVTQSVRDVPTLNTNLLAISQGHLSSAATPTGSPINSPEEWTEFDLTDGDGHGVIVGNQYLYVLRVMRYTTTAGPGLGFDSYYGVKMLYRYKYISYDEFVRQFTFGM